MKKIRPFLKQYPFGYENVGIVFYISDIKGNDLFHPDICIARCTASGVVFRTDDPDKQYRFKENYEETHEEAIALVEKYKELTQNTE